MTDSVKFETSEDSYYKSVLDYKTTIKIENENSKKLRSPLISSTSISLLYLMFWKINLVSLSIVFRLIIYDMQIIMLGDRRKEIITFSSSFSAKQFVSFFFVPQIGKVFYHQASLLLLFHKKHKIPIRGFSRPHKMQICNHQVKCQSTKQKHIFHISILTHNNFVRDYYHLCVLWFQKH